MKLERSNVEFPIWRKKIDKSLFEHSGTTVPEWACRMWGLKEQYGNVTSRKDPESKASTTFRGITYDAWVTTSAYGADAYAFANNEPITLLNGGELLGLLRKHGYGFRINLQEARQVNQTNLHKNERDLSH